MGLVTSVYCVTRVLEACKSKTVDNLWHGREKEQLGDGPSKRSRYAHPVASSDGSDVLRGQKLPPGITIVRVKNDSKRVRGEEKPQRSTVLLAWPHHGNMMEMGVGVGWRGWRGRVVVREHSTHLIWKGWDSGHLGTPPLNSPFRQGGTLDFSTMQRGREEGKGLLTYFLPS